MNKKHPRCCGCGTRDHAKDEVCPDMPRQYLDPDHGDDGYGQFPPIGPADCYPEETWKK